MLHNLTAGALCWVSALQHIALWRSECHSKSWECWGWCSQVSQPLETSHCRQTDGPRHCKGSHQEPYQKSSLDALSHLFPCYLLMLHQLCDALECHFTVFAIHLYTHVHTCIHVCQIYYTTIHIDKQGFLCLFSVPPWSIFNFKQSRFVKSKLCSSPPLQNYCQQNYLKSWQYIPEWVSFPFFDLLIFLQPVHLIMVCWNLHVGSKLVLFSSPLPSICCFFAGK